jgi:2-aminoadipate transaminase
MTESRPIKHITNLLRSDLPPAASRWVGFPEFNFVGGNNDADSVPLKTLAACAEAVLMREGRNLATYFLASGPMGYLPLREFIAAKLALRASYLCDPADILVTTGSMQALDLVNSAFLEPGDTVIIEEGTYGGAIGKLKSAGVNYIGAPLDEDGIRIDALAGILQDLADKGVQPKFIYTIPTVQNPTGSVMPLARRQELLSLARQYGTAIFEDDCYADLLWEGDRPPTIASLDQEGRVLYTGSFSKSIAPALRVGYLIADWPVMSRILPLKKDAGSGALEQMVLAEFGLDHFTRNVTDLTATLKGKCDAMVAALEEQFGASAEFLVPKGGIFIWITLPDGVDTTRLAQVAISEGVAINPGAEWSANAESGRHRLRLCFGNPDKQTIREGVRKLAEICRRETGIPPRSGNIDH